MVINKYSVKLNKDRVNVLVKEDSSEYETEHMDGPTYVYKIMNTLYDLENQCEEYVYIIALDSKNKPIGIFEVSHGTVNMSLLGTREVFVRALLCGATNIILVHNHPSGETVPSTEDIASTKRIISAGNILGISLLDHIVVGKGFMSMKEQQLISF